MRYFRRGCPHRAADGGERVEQRQELGDVVAVAAGEDDGRRCAVAIGDQVVVRARPSPADRRGARAQPPFDARTCEESTTALDRSSRAAAFSSASRTSCRRCHTPASFQNRSRQHVIPDPNPSSCGRCSHRIPVCSTNRIPHSTSRSGTGRRPGHRNRRSLLGSSGSIRAHSSSDTIHREAPTTSPTPNPPAAHGHQDRPSSSC